MSVGASSNGSSRPQMSCDGWLDGFTMVVPVVDLTKRDSLQLRRVLYLVLDVRGPVM